MKGNPVSRREFLQASCLAGAAAGAALCGLGAIAAAGTPAPVVEYPTSTYGESEMDRRILVAYASRAGSTAGVAEAVGRKLAESGAGVDVRPVGEVRDPAGYGAVVIGTAIRGGWLPEAEEFLHAHRATLARVPFASFLVCITLAMRGGENYRDAIRKWMEPARRYGTPVSEGYFAGALDFSKLPLLPEGIQMRIPAALGIFPEGDCRDWAAIDGWAADLASRLLRPA